jgi:hypothetical protein
MTVVVQDPKWWRADGAAGRTRLVTVVLSVLAIGCGGQIAGGTPGGAGAPGQGGPTDGGTCFDDGGIDPSETPASGSFSGPAMSGVICGDGAFVFVEDNLRGTVPAALYGSTNPQTTDGIRFKMPAAAVGGELTVGVGMASPTPGTYESATTCGNLVLSAFLPIPPSIDCRFDGSALGTCPPGCALEGPVSGATCMPVQPEIDFVAQTPMGCAGYSQTSQGSFKLVLTSVDLAPTDAGAGAIHRYRVHGSLTANLVGQAGDAGSSTVSLLLTF